MTTLLAVFSSPRSASHYLFTVNPGNATYGTMMWGMLLCGALLILSLGLRFWRKRLSNPVTKKLSRSWSSASLWFGVIGFVFIVCRVENIQFLSMRFFWVLWFLFALLYIFFQFRQFRARHYEILPKREQRDPRQRYLPKRRSR